MQVSRSFFAGAVVSLALLGGAQPAHAVVVTVDFDTLQTGSDILNNDLVTAAGTISASSTAGSLFLAAAGPAAGGDGLVHQTDNGVGIAVLAFDFDVTSITFDYNGVGTGEFTAIARDASNAIVASFFDPSTSEGSLTGGLYDGTGIVLSGSGIRSFEFSDTDVNFGTSFVDNLLLASVPAPGALGLLVAGLVAMGWRRRAAGG